MSAILVSLFVIVPLVELVVILQVGSMIGAGWTIALLIADSVLGAVLLKVEGRRAWWQFRTALAEGRWPGDEVAQGGLVIVGGTLLLTPGFVTDVIGFLMLLAPTRRVLARGLRRRVATGTIGGARAASGTGAGRRTPGADPEVEVVEIRREPWAPQDDGGVEDGSGVDHGSQGGGTADQDRSIVERELGDGGDVGGRG
jgi:UPF0716 protein FxsA